MASIFSLLFLSLLPVALSLSTPSAPSPTPPRRPPTPPARRPLSPPPRKPLPSPPPSPPRRPPTSPPSSPPIAPPITPPATKPEPPPTPPPPANTSEDRPQMDNIADALIGSGDFGNWIDLLMASGNGSSFPVSATLFVPDDVALPQSKNSNPLPNQVGLDPFLFAYHVVPIRLAFADLRARAVGSRLPTLLPGNSLLITDNSFANFTINGSPITHPDLYLSGAVSVQGVADSFDYKRFGTAESSDLRPPHLADPPSPPPRFVRAPPHRKRPGFTFLPSPTGGGTRFSGSDFFFCCWIPLVFGFGIMMNS